MQLERMTAEPHAKPERKKDTKAAVPSRAPGKRARRSICQLQISGIGCPESDTIKGRVPGHCATLGKADNSRLLKIGTGVLTEDG